MSLTLDQHQAALERAGGRCRFCHKQLSRLNHGRGSGRGAYETDHSVPRSRGGSDHGRNLYAACADCNIQKSDMYTAEFMLLKQPSRNARFNRRLSYNTAQLAGPAALIGGVAVAALKESFDQWAAANPKATVEERQAAINKFFLIPLALGAGVFGISLLWRMFRR